MRNAFRSIAGSTLALGLTATSALSAETTVDT